MLDVNSTTGLPLPQSLSALFGGNHTDLVLRRVEDSLVRPAAELIARPSKRFRAQLVSIGYDLGGGKRVSNGNISGNTCSNVDSGSDSSLVNQRLEICAKAVELLHAGSLIVDDIQDLSAVRRGGAAIHRVYGVPSALCTGNWLYFWPLRLLRALALPLAREHQAFALYHEALEKAHCGQALDLSLDIHSVPRAEVEELTRALVELKTGAVTALALSLGALIAGECEQKLQAISDFGKSFGASLQELDDLGNLLGDFEPEKACEDIRRGKLSGIWTHVVKLLDQDAFTQLLAASKAVAAGNERPLDQWLRRTEFAKKMRAEVTYQIKTRQNEFAVALGLPSTHSALVELSSLGDKLLDAYC